MYYAILIVLKLIHVHAYKDIDRYVGAIICCCCCWPTVPSLVCPPRRLRLRVSEFQSNRSPVRFVATGSLSRLSASLLSASTSSHSTFLRSTSLIFFTPGMLPSGIRDQSNSAIANQTLFINLKLPGAMKNYLYTKSIHRSPEPGQ